ncbi:MAG: gfo/Idh/MocA family oxidoreductase [Clostridiales bacterium]|nr:MAG: gfo/Idh/MocA family oxidoreductase [Clostridiales bacterium]
MAYKAILVGTGTWGEWWCEKFLPPNIADGTVEVVAAVDRNPAALGCAKKFLHLSDAQCYTDAETAFRENKADFCINVVTPAHHEEIVDLAIKYGLNILSEKPIADTLEGSIRIAEKVKKAGLKMGVTMSHRFDQDKTSMRGQLRSGRWGELDYIITRFTCDCRKYGSWGDFRHEIANTLLLEGAVHHLDILADFAGAKCDTVYAQTWHPRWGEFKGDCQALITMTFENGTKAFYEGAKTNAVSLNTWANEYFRAECENATLVLNKRRLEVFPYNPETSWAEGVEGQGLTIPLLQQKKWANTWLIEQFVRWLDGGEPMETDVEDNLQAVAHIFSAIESVRTGQVVKVQQFLNETREKVLAGM